MRPIKKRTKEDIKRDKKWVNANVGRRVQFITSEGALHPVYITSLGAVDNYDDVFFYDEDGFSWRACGGFEGDERGFWTCVADTDVGDLDNPDSLSISLNRIKLIQ